MYLAIHLTPGSAGARTTLVVELQRIDLYKLFTNLEIEVLTLQKFRVHDRANMSKCSSTEGNKN